LADAKIIGLKLETYFDTVPYLHRNREIIATLMGNSVKETIDKAILTRAKFRWEYMTGVYWNKEGKMYRLVYDFAWMDFSDQRVLIVRKKNSL